MISLQFVTKAKFDCLEDPQLLKVLWNYVLEINGMVFVTSTGAQMMPKLSADSWDSTAVSCTSSCPLSHLAICSPSSITGAAVYNSYYGLGTSLYVWTNVAGGCKGNETALLSCPRNTVPTTCTLNDLAGVQCSVPCTVTYMYTLFPLPPSISLYLLVRLNCRL